MEHGKVLIVEDENIVALDLKRRLSRLGYSVVGMAAHADQAIALIEDYHPDIILMDIHIRGHTDGIDVARLVAEKYQIPVIFLTAYSEDATLARASATKPYGYLLKPFSERELHAAIQVALERYAADSQLQKREAHLKLALEAGKLSTWEMQTCLDPVILGYTPDGGLSQVKNWNELIEAIVPDDREKVMLKIDRLRHEEDAEIEIEFELADPDLGLRWYVMFGKCYRRGLNSPQQVVGVIQDTTERRLIEENLKQAAMVFRCSADGIVILDHHHRVVSINEAFSRITGYDSEQVVGNELALLSPGNFSLEEDRPIWAVIAEQGSWQGEIRAFRRNHELLCAWVNIGVVPDAIDTVGQYVVVVSDVTAMRDAQEKLSRIAYYDTLTNLPNRNLFMDRLDLLLAKAKRDQNKLGILFLDLDHFKRVNDTLGHQVGDVMLRAVAQRLKSELRTTDTLCRIGGDEFIVIIDTLSSNADMEMLANKLLSALDKPLLLGSTEIVPGASIGISIYPDDTTDRDDLIKMADTAMYSAKNDGRSGYAFYQPEMTVQTAHYLNRERELRLALKKNEFILYYQPQYSAASGEIIGLEALIRWQHPELGLVSAAEIIPIAEMSVLIVEIGEWVIDEVCCQYHQWSESGLSPVRIAINVSVRQLQDRRLVSVVADALTRHQVPAEHLEFEVTESCLQDNESSVRCLQELERLGVPISIDDFGTGYSCMSSLKKLPIHRLKIDQAFVRDIPASDSDCAIASAIIALGQQLKLKVIAEGIESKDQAEYMRSAGCDELQGFLFSRPLPAADIQKLLFQAKSRKNAG